MAPGALGGHGELHKAASGITPVCAAAVSGEVRLLCYGDGRGAVRGRRILPGDSQ